MVQASSPSLTSRGAARGTPRAASGGLVVAAAAATGSRKAAAATTLLAFSPVAAATPHTARRSSSSSRLGRRQVLLVGTALMAFVALFLWVVASNSSNPSLTSSSLLSYSSGSASASTNSAPVRRVEYSNNPNYSYDGDRPLLISIDAGAADPKKKTKTKNNKEPSTTASFLRERRTRAGDIAKSNPPAVVFVTADIQRSLFVEYYYDPQDGEHNLEYVDRFLQPDYGGLELESLRVASAVFARRARDDDEKLHRQHRAAVLEAADAIYVSSRYSALEDVDYLPGDCVAPPWSVRSRPNCNALHELVQLERVPDEGDAEADDPDSEERRRVVTPTATATTVVDARYLAHGYYRDTYLITSHSAMDNINNNNNNNNSDGERVVLKQLRYKHDSDARMQRKMLTEAKTMEVLTPSRVTSDIYGHCSTSLLVEAARELTRDIVPHAPERGQKSRGRISHAQLQKLEQEHGRGGPYSFNNFTTAEKLDIAIQIAEGLAEMHGHRDGVMVNDDVHPDQWLRADDGRVILNDMNNAVVLEWNFVKQDYCPYFSSYGGDYRAPEEYRERGALVDETVDLWPMGNLIHSLLTGLWPYYDLDDDEEIQAVTLRGERPYLHPDYRSRSLIERRMTEIMDRCHVLKPQDRVDIFTVVEHLRETKRLHQQQQQKQQQQEKQQANRAKNNNTNNTNNNAKDASDANDNAKTNVGEQKGKKFGDPKGNATATKKEKPKDAAKKEA